MPSLYKSYIYPVELSVCPGEGSFSTGAVYRVLTYGTNQAHLYGAGSSGEGAGGLQSDYLSVSGGTKGSVGIYYVILKNTRKPNLVIKGVKIYCPAPPYQSLNYISVNLIDRTARNMNLELTGSPQYVEFKPYFYVQSDPIYPYQDGRGAIFSFGRTMYRYTVAISYVFVDGSESPYTIYDFSYP
ncbi:MAG: hypothetical protein PHT32_06190 [Candidatus Omnitrophica bacterium]|nr:hypothetical protein [Candidatus Omnitrophota bacterium]